MRQFLLLLLFLGSVAFGAAIECEDGFRAISASPFPPTPLRPWKFSEGNLLLSPEQVFSRSFLEQLQKVGPVVAVVGQRDGESVPGIPAQRALFVTIRAGEETVVQLELRQDLWEPGTFYLEDLFTQNPAWNGAPNRSSKRYENQVADENSQVKGLPFEEFSRVQSMLEEIIRKGGGNRFRTSGAQDYIVTRLYTSRVKLKPVNENSRRTLEMLEDIRRYFAKSYPRELWSEADSFRNILGTAGERTISEVELRAWKQYQETGKLPKDAAIYPSPEDPKIFTMLHQGERFTSFIDSMTAGKPLLQWADLHQGGRLLLEKEIP